MINIDLNWPNARFEQGSGKVWARFFPKAQLMALRELFCGSRGTRYLWMRNVPIVYWR